MLKRYPLIPSEPLMRIIGHKNNQVIAAVTRIVLYWLCSENQLIPPENSWGRICGMSRGFWHTSKDDVKLAMSEFEPYMVDSWEKQSYLLKIKRRNALKASQGRAKKLLEKRGGLTDKTPSIQAHTAPIRPDPKDMYRQSQAFDSDERARILMENKRKYRQNKPSKGTLSDV